MTTKAKVYKDIICLEVSSPEGGKWWFQTPTLAYTPYHIDRIQKLVWGKLTGTARMVLAAALRQNGREVLVGINIARSDVAALRRKKILPEGCVLPERQDVYTPWPEHARARLADLKNKGSRFV